MHVKKEWRSVKGTDGSYWVSRQGEIIIKDNRTARTVSQSVGNGALVVNIRVGGKFTTRSVSRVVAEAFIRGSEKGSRIEHANGDRTDNSVQNLQLRQKRQMEKGAS